MSSPPAIMGTTMYVWTPDCRRASTSGPDGSPARSSTCNSPLRRASTSPMNSREKRTPGPRCVRWRPTPASHSTVPACRSNRFTIVRGTPSRSRSRRRAASAMATGAVPAMIAWSISCRTPSRSAYVLRATSACLSSVTSVATTRTAGRPPNSMACDATFTSRTRPSLSRCRQAPAWCTCAGAFAESVATVSRSLGISSFGRMSVMRIRRNSARE